MTTEQIVITHTLEYELTYSDKTQRKNMVSDLKKEPMQHIYGVSHTDRGVPARYEASLIKHRTAVKKLKGST